MENKIRATCRLCLEMREDCVQIRESHWGVQALKDIFQIEIEYKDGLSKEVCSFCLTRMSAFYSFFLEVKANQTKLKPLEAIKIKQEPGDSEDVQSVDDDDEANHIIRLGPGIQIRVLEGQPMKFEDLPLEPSVQIKEEESDGGRSGEPKRPKSDTQCDLCFKTFSKKYGLQRHLREVHYWSKQIKCHVCHKIFGTEEDLESHLQLHESLLSPMKALYCDLCDRYFSSQASIQKHVGTMHNDLRPFGCDLCRKKFKQLGHLQTHKKTHMAEKPLKCGKCDARFKVLFNLRRHEKLHEKWDAKDSVSVLSPADAVLALFK